MKTTNFIKRALSSTIIAGVAMTAMPAYAQQVGADEDDVLADTSTAGEPGDASQAGEVIVVTGTRLNVNPNLEAAAPVLSVSDAEITGRGITRVEDLVNQLPQVFAGQAGEVSNGASGTATLNLRGLGSVRTLVLIDGRRLPYGASNITAPNLDLVPTQLIDRIDILTGGASAVYGSDAVGGVANFILKRDFEGLEIDIQGGFAQNGNDIDFFENVLAAGNVPIPGNRVDGEEYSITGILGTNTADGRGNVTVYANYENRQAITQDDRTISACTMSQSSSTTTAFEGVGCVGSANFRLFGNNIFVFQQPDGTLTNFQGGPAETYNFGPLNFFQRPSERWSLYGKAFYEVADGVEAFLDLSYTDNVSDAQIAETASFGFGAYSINCDNPFLVNNPGVSFYDVFGCTAADIAAGNDVSGITASHRNVEGGPRNSRLENSAFRVVGGVRGDVFDYWDYEIFGQYAETSDTSISTNDFVVANLQQALFAVRDPATGQIVCRDPSGGCVPYNPFQRNADGTTRITQAQTDYLQGVGIVVGSTEQRVLGANIQADLGNYGISSPFTDAGIGFLAGVEVREDVLASIPDEISQVPGGGFTGVGGATLPVAGDITVWELYTELQVPLITDRPGFRELTVNGQYRYSDYTTNGNGVTGGFQTDAYGVQLVWAPVDALKLRAQYQRAVRAPNVIELFTGQDVGLPNLNLGNNGFYDPCAGPNPAASAAACANTGVTATQYGNIIDVISGQTQGIFGGNPDLQPESSDTYTVGVVFEPDFVPGFSVSLDYFDITVSDFIAAGIGAQTILDNCLATGDPQFCDLITRDSSGSLNSGTAGTGFLLTNVNIAELYTAGFDAQILYNIDLPVIGEVRFDYAGTYLTNNEYTPFPGGDLIDCNGFLNNDCVAAVNPVYRHRLLAGFDLPMGVGATVTWRHFGPTQNDANDPEEIDDKLPAINYLDLAFTADLTDDIGLRLGVLNVLNQQAPLSASSGPPTGNGNTYPVIYDTGRFFFGGVNFKF